MLLVVNPTHVALTSPKSEGRSCTAVKPEISHNYSINNRDLRTILLLIVVIYGFVNEISPL